MLFILQVSILSEQKLDYLHLLDLSKAKLVGTFDCEAQYRQPLFEAMRLIKNDLPRPQTSRIAWPLDESIHPKTRSR